MNTSLRNSLAALAATFTATALLAGPPKVGDPFPSLNQPGMAGTIPDLAGKVVLVDFWASWCGPCKKSFPAVKELQEKYGPKGFVVVAVSLDEDEADMRAFLKKNPVPFTILRDAKAKLADLAGVEGIPASFMLDREGKVRHAHVGYAGDKTKQELETQIEALLKP